MAAVKISELPSADTLTGDEIFPLNQDDVTKTTTLSGLRAVLGGFSLAVKPDAYETVLADANSGFINPTGNGANIYTITSNNLAAYTIGTFLIFINSDNTKTIVVEINNDTLVWAEDGTTGQRAVAPRGIAIALKTTATEWLIFGVGLS